MPKNQLFKIIPNKDFIYELIKLFGLNDINDNKYFSLKDLEDIKTLDNIIFMKDKLETYYIPCKSKIYLKNITLKRCIVILRQFLKIISYTLNSKEKYINGKKTTIYQIIPIKTSIEKTQNIQTKIKITFE